LHATELLTNGSICLLGSNFKAISRCGDNIASVLNCLCDDGLELPGEDCTNVQALIQDYFDKSDKSGSDNDEDGSKR